MRVAAYIDGFNLYYRALKSSKFKWLNIHRLCEGFLVNGQSLVYTKYFTARVKPRPTDPEMPKRQQIFFSALQTEPDFSFYYGRFLPKTKKRPLVSDPTKFAEVHDTEEKGSDVNLAAHLLNDAWKDSYDAALVLSQDTDLCEPMRMVSRELKKGIGLVVLDGKEPNKRLRKVSSFVHHVTPARLSAAQFPNPVIGANGKEIWKPSSW